MILAALLFIAGVVLLPVFAFAAFDASKRADEADEAMFARMVRGHPDEFSSLQQRGE